MGFWHGFSHRMAGNPYFTGILRVAFLNSSFATKLSLGCSDICKMHKYRIEKKVLLYILYNGCFWNQKCPAVRMDIFVPTPGKKCSIFGIKIYQKRTMIYRNKNGFSWEFMDFHEKSRFLPLKNATMEIFWNLRNPVFMRVSAIYRKRMWHKWQNEEKFCHTRKPLFYRAERGLWHRWHNFLSQL